MEFDHRSRYAPLGSAAAADNALAPGKLTLTEQLPVQRRETTGASRSDGAASEASVPSVGSRPTLQMLFGVQRAATTAPAEDPAQVHAAASHGTATPATPLPHFNAIQRAFGRHDISGIQAHIGPEAAASTREMGARAYATGNHVVLGEGADLNTVVHEAAHVVQQHGGVHLSGGVGQVGDAYERQADEVAALVVQGKSAEATLDGLSPGAEAGSQTTQHKAVQRQSAPSTDGRQGYSVPTLGNSMPQSSRQLSSTEWSLEGFGTNSEALTPDHEQVIAQIAQDLNTSGLGWAGSVTIMGRADSRGAEDYNNRLGQQRADRVRARLITEIRDTEVAQQIRAYSIGEAANNRQGDVAEYRQVTVTITRGTLRMPGPQLGLVPLQPQPPPPPPSINLFPPGALLPPSTAPSGPPTLPPNFWTLPSPQLIPRDFIHELSQWLTAPLGREQIAKLASRIAGAIGMDRAQVQQQLDESLVKAGEAGLKEALRTLFKAITRPLTSAPANPSGLPEELPKPDTYKTPPIPF